MTFYIMKKVFLSILNPVLMFVVAPLLVYIIVILDKPTPTEYTCQKIEGLLIGGWYLDISPTTIQQCRKLKQQLQEKSHVTTT